jgi:trigger factor
VKSAVENLSPTRAKLTVEVPFEELKPSLDAAYKKIARRSRCRASAAARCPPAVIDRQVGRGPVLVEAFNKVVPCSTMAALQEARPRADRPAEIEVTRFEDDQGVEFTAEVDVKPDFELPSLRRDRGAGRRLEITTPTWRSRSRRSRAVRNPRDRRGARSRRRLRHHDLVAARDGETSPGRGHRNVLQGGAAA